MLKKLFVISCLVVATFAPVLVMASPLKDATEKLNTSLKGTGLETTTLQSSIGTVVRAILSLVGTIFLVLTIYAGILWMTAQGANEQIEKAQNIISAAIIGLVITMAAYAITSFVTGRLGNLGTGAPETAKDQPKAPLKVCDRDYKEGMCKPADYACDKAFFGATGLVAHDTSCPAIQAGYVCCYRSN